ncbi:MAG: hypothetical protein HRT93_00545 [Piscirickettsiaceae bacterium]|nr:hypothetical protein [Piscirickettsiaceae bacterium]
MNCTKILQQTKVMTLMLLASIFSVQASDSIIISSDTGDTLMIHRLNDGELWGSFMITDQIADNFADYEMIVLQVDQHKPIKMDHQKLCGSPARAEQKVNYTFDTEATTEQWLFSQVTTPQPDILKLTGWDKEEYQHTKSDRRPNVVDFPILGPIALPTLSAQFQQGDIVIFRYTTDADEVRQARFELQNEREAIKRFLDI